MNFQKKILLIIASFISLISLFIFITSIINIAQKQYITGSFYTLEELIIMVVISCLISIFFITFIIFQIKRK